MARSGNPPMSDEELISFTVKQIEGFNPDNRILYSGLAVCAWDINQYLKNNPRNDASRFKEIIREVEAQSRIQAKEGWYESFRYFPYTDSDFPKHDLEQLPHGMAKKADEGSDEGNPLKDLLDRLNDIKIVYEWTSHPGELLFDQLKKRAKESICRIDGPYGKFRNNLLDQRLLSQETTKVVMKEEFSMDVFWAHLAAYFAVLLVRLYPNLMTYCGN
jgi:hypothetical protein